VGYNGEQSQDSKQIFSIVSHNAGNFSSVVSYTTTESYAVYCIPEKSSALYPTTPQVFFRCITQWKIFSSIMGYNRRGFFRCGIQWKKIIQSSMIFLNFKCLSLPLNENLGKICYLNSQTYPWKELKMENYMVNHETFFFH
jgi:hypothetical protein